MDILVINLVIIGRRCASSQALSFARKFSKAGGGGAKTFSKRGTGRGVGGWGGKKPAHVYPSQMVKGELQQFCLYYHRLIRQTEKQHIIQGVMV